MNGFAVYSGAERRVSNTRTYWGPERRFLWNNIRPDERTLVERAARHDRNAFLRLYDRFVDKIYRYAYYRTGEQTSAEEITEKVFLYALESINQFPWSDRPFVVWLYQIAQKQVSEYLHPREYAVSSAECMTDTIRGAFGEYRPDAQAVRRAFSRLTQDQQLVVILRFLDGYNIEQIARLLGRPPEAITGLQHRALVAISGLVRRGSGKT